MYCAYNVHSDVGVADEAGPSVRRRSMTAGGRAARPLSLSSAIAPIRIPERVRLRTSTKSVKFGLRVKFIDFSSLVLCSASFNDMVTNQCVL